MYVRQHLTPPTIDKTQNTYIVYDQRTKRKEPEEQKEKTSSKIQSHSLTKVEKRIRKNFI